jgi:hypothetical protein
MADSQSRKRKAAEELSQNPHTVKARNRNEKLEGIQLELENHKKADTAAITYAFSKLKNTKEYKEANKDKKAMMKEECKRKTTHKR